MMAYTVIYVENGERKWKKAISLDIAEAFGKEHTDADADYEINVSLFEYNTLKNQMEIMREQFKQIENICKNVR